MDKFGNGEELCLARVLQCCPPPATGLSFRNFSEDMFLGKHQKAEAHRSGIWLTVIIQFECVKSPTFLCGLIFAAMCVLAGCDFLASIPGIGVKTAHGLLAKYRNVHRVRVSLWKKT